MTVPSYRLEVALHACARVCPPAILLADKRERGRVIDLSTEAKRRGARVGMTVLQAQAVVSDAVIFVHDPLRSAQIWDDILDALDCVSPLIDDRGEGTAYLWMQGVSGTPQAWMQRVRTALNGFDLPVRVGAAHTMFAARAAARIKDGTVCESGAERALLAPLEIDLLDIEPEMLSRLQLLGIATLGDLAKLPHGPFVRRFGKRATQWHRHAQGIDLTQFLPRPHHLQIEARLAGEGAAESEEQVYFALRMLVSRVQEDLSRLGKRAGMLVLRLECENADVREIQIRIAQPTADATMLFDLARAKVEGLLFESPITGLWLQATQFEDGGVPATLFAGSDPDPMVVELAIARLEAALADSPARAHVLPAHRPESQFTYERFARMPAALPPGISALPMTDVPPQLRLLHVHEIDVHVRKSAPAFVGSPPQAVLDFAGPWRIDETWFEQPVVRDEYDVLLEDGALYRIFHQGGRWYLRGAYD
ncbi:MAG: DNA polymerase Y family protein [Candidatus Eremiobacteraeota bacterium]|nr:DNA polymerase Y family protein [Candidatus Eremiobacteraeota bacterium]